MKRIRAPRTEAEETEKEKNGGQSPAARVRKTKTAGQGSWPHDLSGNRPGRAGDAESDEPGGLRWKHVEKISEGHNTEAAAEKRKTLTCPRVS
jgi:hypothetical protein